MPEPLLVASIPSAKLSGLGWGLSSSGLSGNDMEIDIRNGSTGDYIYCDPQPSRTSGATGLYRNLWSSWASGLTLHEWYNSAGTAVLRLRTTASNTWALQRWDGAAWVTVGTAGVLSSSSSVRFNVDFSGLGTSSGALTFQIFSSGSTNELLHESITTGLDLTSVTNIASFRHYNLSNGTPSTSGLGRFYIKDGFGGSVFSYQDRPTVAGTDNTDGSGGFAEVDDINTTVGSGDADFISLTASGQKKSVRYGTRSYGTARAVKSVHFGARMRAGTTGPNQVKPYLLIGGTRYYHPSSPVTLTASFQGYVFTWENNPATGSPWTNAEAQDANLETGIEVV